MGQIINEKDLKKVIEQLMLEQPEFFKKIFKEIISENPEILTAEAEREKRINKIIDKHFDRFDDVFKALA
jgi:hypothetical protein